MYQIQVWECKWPSDILLDRKACLDNPVRLPCTSSRNYFFVFRFKFKISKCKREHLVSTSGKFHEKCAKTKNRSILKMQLDVRSFETTFSIQNWWMLLFLLIRSFQNWFQEVLNWENERLKHCFHIFFFYNLRTKSNFKK